MSEEKNALLPILDAVAAVLRNWWTVIAGACLGLAAAVAILHQMPKIYEAKTTIFVAPPKVPETLVRSTVTDDMAVRMAALQRTMLSRPYMERLLQQTLGLPDDPQVAERKINGVKSAIKVSVNPVRISNNQQAGFFDLTYRHQDPEMVAKVVNTLAQLWLEENAERRTSRAAETSSTMRELVERERAEIQAIEAAITQFKAQHQYELAENRDANLTLLESARSAVETVRGRLQAAQTELQTLEARMLIYEGQRSDSTAGGGSWESRVADAREKLADLERRYSAQHPDVQRARRELQDLLAAEPEEDEHAAPAPITDPTYVTLQNQVDSARAEISRLESELRRRQADVGVYQRRIDATPGVAQSLAELMDGYEAKKREYDDLISRAQSAEQSEVLETKQQGKQFDIVEEAFTPTIPVSPQPMLIYGALFLVGIGLCVGPVVLYTLLVPKVASQATIEEITDVPVLVSVPRIATPTSRRRERKRGAWNWSLSAASMLILIGTVLTLGA